VDSDHQADKAWLLSVQRKLYQWSRQHPDESYRELWNWIIDPRNLRCAWARVATNQGKRTAGIDGKTVGSIRRDIGEDAYLGEVRSALRRGTYVPSPCRRKLIPKPGKPGQFRALGIPTVNPNCTVTQRSIGMGRGPTPVPSVQGSSLSGSHVPACRRH